MLVVNCNVRGKCLVLLLIDLVLESKVDDLMIDSFIGELLFDREWRLSWVSSVGSLVAPLRIVGSFFFTGVL